MGHDMLSVKEQLVLPLKKLIKIQQELAKQDKQHYLSLK